MTETLVTSNGITLWTTSQGTGTPIVLCNGGPACCDYLAPVASMLDNVAQIIRFEQRPSLLKDLAQLDRPALFLYGQQDIRPSWPVQQVAQYFAFVIFALRGKLFLKDSTGTRDQDRCRWHIGQTISIFRRPYDYQTKTRRAYERADSE